MNRKKLQELEAREDALIDWLFDNQPSHPNYDSKVSELNNVRCRIYAIEHKPKQDEMRGIKEHTIPKHLK